MRSAAARSSPLSSAAHSRRRRKGQEHAHLLRQKAQIAFVPVFKHAHFQAEEERFAPPFAFLSNFPELLQKQRLVHRLEQVIDGLLLDGALEIVHPFVAAHDHEFSPIPPAVRLLHHFQPVHFGHVHVGDHHVRADKRDLLEALERVPGGEHLQIQAFLGKQHGLHALEDNILIVHEQYVHVVSSSLSPARPDIFCGRTPNRTLHTVRTFSSL